MVFDSSNCLSENKYFWSHHEVVTHPKVDDDPCHDTKTLFTVSVTLSAKRTLRHVSSPFGENCMAEKMNWLRAVLPKLRNCTMDR